ncbi:MAG: QueT transporter family protein [Erysipelotrichaceae bacterium]|nr:QueT transporter family protein [Erysipelotrichaceae bacterium]
MDIKKLRKLAQAAIIAALYVALTVIFAPIGFGEIQVRIAEALTILPVFSSSAIGGLFVGCILGNLFGGAILPDVIFGSIATLIGAIGTYALRNKPVYIAVLPPIISNMCIVPLILHFAYQVDLPIWMMMLTVGAGEVISCGLLGILLYKGAKPHTNKLFVD